MTVDLLGNTGACGPDCDAFLAKWLPWWDRQLEHPVALLDTGADYLQRVGAKTRNMVRKADGLYVYREFDYNSRLDEIHAVNVSKPTRSGGPMSDRYLAVPVPIVKPWDTCDQHRSGWWGGFDNADRLIAYCNLVELNDLGVVNTVLGHADAPAAMNGLFAYLARHATVRFIHYLSLASSPPSLAAFKRHVGFAEVTVAA